VARAQTRKHLPRGADVLCLNLASTLRLKESIKHSQDGVPLESALANGP